MKMNSLKLWLGAMLLFGAVATGALAAEPVAPGAPEQHVIDASEIQGQIQGQIQSEEANRQEIRDLLARPDVRRVAGSAGLSLERADAAVSLLSGAELERLAEQARLANSQIAGGETVTMTWTMVIIIVVALVVLIAVL